MFTTEERYYQDVIPDHMIDPETGLDRRGIGNMERSFIEGMVPKNAEEIAYDDAVRDIDAVKNKITSLTATLLSLIPELSQTMARRRDCLVSLPGINSLKKRR